MESTIINDIAVLQDIIQDIIQDIVQGVSHT